MNVKYNNPIILYNKTFQMVSEQSSIWEAPASPMMRQTSHAPRKFKGEARESHISPLQRGVTINKWRHSPKKLME